MLINTNLSHYQQTSRHLQSTTQLNVCHLAKYYYPARGGVETVVRDFAEGLTQRGHEVTIACINHQDSKSNDVTFSKFARTHTRSEHIESVSICRYGRVASFARFDFSPQLMRNLKQLLNRGFDLIHVHEPNPTMAMACLLANSKLPMVVTYHSDVVNQKWLWKLYQPFQSRLLNRAKSVMCSSQGYKNSSKVLSGFHAKTEILPFGIDLQPFLYPSEHVLSKAAQLKASHGEPLWLMVGRLVYYKGYEIALEALKSTPGKLLIVGNGPLKEQLVRQAEELQLSDRIIWLENVAEHDLLALYRAATALWFPSTHRSEAFGLVQIEAMASGCPVINTSIEGSGVSEVSLDGISGVTIQPGHADQLAAASRKLLQETGCHELLSKGAIIRAKSEFDKNIMIDRLIDIYHRALSN